MADTIAMSASSALLNATSAVIPSPVDLLMALPRLARRAGSFLVYLPEQFDGLLSMARNSGSVIADPTSKSMEINSTTITSLATSVVQTLSDAQSTPTPTSVPRNGLSATIVQGFNLQAFNNLDGVFSYIASRWAISTFLVVSFIIQLRNLIEHRL